MIKNPYGTSLDFRGNYGYTGKVQKRSGQKTETYTEFYGGS